MVLLAGCAVPEKPGAPSASAPPSEVIEFEMVVAAAACAEPAGGCSRLTAGGATHAFYAVGNSTTAPLLFAASWTAADPFAEELRFRIWFVNEAAPTIEFDSRSPASLAFDAPVGKDFSVSARPSADPAISADIRIDATLEGPVRGPRQLG